MKTNQPTARRFPPALLLLAAPLAALLLAACSGNGGSNNDGPVVTDLRSNSSTVVYDTNVGIHASGIGIASGDPDIAVLSLGVEALRDSVGEARAAAASALAAIVAELREAGVAEDDIRTAHFSINPRYEYLRDGEPELRGFQVTNTLNVTLRDLNAAGDIVDRAVAAGGDLTRIHGISFQVEDTAALEREARISALQDAVEKADLYAEQLGVSRGALISVSESSSDPYPFAVAESRMAFDSAMAAPSTEFFAGELEVSVRVQVVFGIQ